MTRIPSLRNTSSKEALNLLSRSWTRKRVRSKRSVKPRLRACWVTQLPVGFRRAAGEVDAPTAHLEKEQNVETAERHRLDGEEITRQHAGRLLAQELPPA